MVVGMLVAPRSELVALAGAAFVAMAVVPTPDRRELRLVARPGLAAIGALAVVAGAWFGQMRRATIDRSELGPLLGREVTVRATLLERPRSGEGAGPRAAVVRLVDGRGRGERVVMRAWRWPRVPLGGELVASGRLVALGRRDGWLRRRGVHARLLADRPEATGRRRGGLAGVLDRTRGGAERAVASGLDPSRAGLARGMVLGQDEALDDETRRAFRDSGLAHLLAASGQNVMLLVALALPALAALGAGSRGRLAGCLVAIALYVPLAGGGPSILRAGVMAAAGIAATLASRPSSRWYALLLAAAVTLGLNPYAAADPGWQLSFAAVAAISLLARPLAGALAGRGVPRFLAEAGALTATATLGTAPLLAFHFERLSLVSLAANLLAVPAVAPAMWLGMLAILAGAAVPAAAVLVNALAQLPLAYLEWLARAAAGLPHASVAVRIPSVPALLAAYGSIALLTHLGRRAWTSGRDTPRTFAAGAAALAALAVASGPRPGTGGVADPPDPRAVVVSFLDVGQGDATLVQHAGATILVDAGPPGSPLLEHLRRAGVDRIDLLAVTHAQADHEGGAAAVLDRHPVGLLLDGGDGAPTSMHRGTLAAADRRRVRRLVPHAGQVLRVGPVELRVLWPEREPRAPHAGEDPNRRAVVAHVRAGDFDLLLPADAESEVTAGLDLPAVEALKVAHHGSADPGLPDLLARLRPRVAAIEVGRDNRYGHPTPQTLAALRAVPVARRTDRDGTIRLTWRDGRMTVSTER